MSDITALLTAAGGLFTALVTGILAILGFVRTAAKERREAASKAAEKASIDDEQERQIQHLRAQLERLTGEKESTGGN